MGEAIALGAILIGPEILFTIALVALAGASVVISITLGIALGRR